MKYIATVTNTVWETTIEQEYTPADDATCDFLITAGILIKYDETSEPRPGRKVYVYVSGVSYPADSLILKDSVHYLSDVDTSTTWVIGEYTVV